MARSEAGEAADAPAAAADAGSAAAPAERPTPDPVLFDAFRRLFLEAAPRGELDGLSSDEREQLIGRAFAVLAERRAGTSGIHVGQGEGGAGDRHMAVVLVQDDMPFLVSSATATVAVEGLSISRLVHPVMAVERDGQGRLTGLTRPAAEPGWPRESLVAMEVERAPARLRARLGQRLLEAYGDVALAVADWQPMQARLRLAARRLNDSPPPVAPHVVAETIAFLDWLAADNFTFLGVADEGPDSQPTLGILKDAARWPASPPAGAEHQPLVIAKARQRSTVHRAVALDLVLVRRFDTEGRAAGHTLLTGLFTSAALNESPRRVPLIRRKVADVAERLGHDPRGHAGKALAHVIESFPREELFQMEPGPLADMAEAVLTLLDRPRPRLFFHRAEGSQRQTALLYMPREAYSSELRESAGRLLAELSGGRIDRFEVELRAQGLARVHFVIEDAGRDVDEAVANRELLRLTLGWPEEVEAALADEVGALRAARLALGHAQAFGPGYRAEFSPAEAAADILMLHKLASVDERRAVFARRAGDGPRDLRLKIYRLGEIIPLSEAVPMLENFGFRVIEEASHDLAGGEIGWIHDFRLELAQPVEEWQELARLLEPALAAVMAGEVENDGFLALVTAAGLDARQCTWFRAWFRYLRQTGLAYGVATVVDALRRNPRATRSLMEAFQRRHDPDLGDRDRDRDGEAEAALEEALAAVEGIDDDRILRVFAELVASIVRTNAFAPMGRQALAFKIVPGDLAWLPPPQPWREIWVYAVRVEGVHLRGGPLARGGLRWSDRRDDFRIEVMDLVRAQIVKNAVIVPTGAKGGFYPKQLPDPADREAWAREGREAYRLFIRALLSVTDNRDLEAGTVEPPERVVRHDGDDPYLVVAADKGTATFSDTANVIAEEAGFWLGDAFASGGSAGYDHKAMGITARGAWVSVERHFAEMGVDVANDPVTVAGVGDMSGDVFGNGMLRSCSLKLVAAFDHRHIFLDPDPDPEASFRERQRLYEADRSSWDDYDRELLSEGGQVASRTEKRIALSPQMRERLGVDDEALSPSALIQAILRAPVDLLWFGGIGTYVKAAAEAHAVVGDRANDPHRVDGEELRARVVAEGANLALTQAGRVAFALSGGRINTDFIDNSAGVDTSDHEVNIKLALGAAERAGLIDRAERDRMLEQMADEVAAIVLGHNAEQTRAISLAEADAGRRRLAHERLIENLEARGRLDRGHEGLPSSQQIAERKGMGCGLVRPELAVLLAWARIDLKEELMDSGLAGDPLLAPDLANAFPQRLAARFPACIEAHPLVREIVATRLANELVQEGGLTLAHDLADELGCPLAQVAGAWVAARALFDVRGLKAAIEPVSDVQARLVAENAASDALQGLIAELMTLSGAGRPSQLVERLQPGLARLGYRLDDLLRPEPRAQIEQQRQRLAAQSLPAEVIERVARLMALSGGVGVSALAADLDIDPVALARGYTLLGSALGLDWALGLVGTLDPADGWERMLLADTRRQFQTIRLALLRGILAPGEEPERAVGRWLRAREAAARALKLAVQHARGAGAPTIPMLAHVANLAREALSTERAEAALARDGVPG